MKEWTETWTLTNAEEKNKQKYGLLASPFVRFTINILKQTNLPYNMF